MSQLTGSDEGEKRKKKKKKKRKDLRQRARIGGCTANEEGLQYCLHETKVERGKQLFPRRRIVPPLATCPSPIWPVSSCPFTLSYRNCHHLPVVFGAS